jgi:hypothetical protein
MLGAVPDTLDTASYVAYADFEAYWDGQASGPPPRGATQDEFDDWFTALGGFELGADDAPLIGGSRFAWDGLQEIEAYRSEIGLDPATVRQSLETGAPPQTYNVLRGDFSADEIDASVQADANFSDLLVEETRGDVTYHSWGEDFAIDGQRISPVHTLGRGGRLGLHDDLLFWCFWTEGMTGMIDAATDEADSLADRQDFMLMTKEIDRVGAYSAQLAVTTDLTIADAQLEPIVAAASASGMDDDGVFLLLVLVHADEASAQQNLTQLETAFAGEPERVTSVTADGRGVLVTALLRGPDLPWNVLIGGI